MASDMDWSHDFCLYCDKQIAEGAYCSQACRLTDLEKAGTSEPASPYNFPSTSAPSSWTSTGNHSGFYLPPAVNFAAYKMPSRHDSPPTSPTSSTSSSRNPYFSQPASSSTTQNQQSKRGLTPSSSRSSLSSMSSNTTVHGLSAKAINELRGYASSFDQVRDMKRRLTVP
ncbi:hypothetical protein M501DRAFT_931051 [Patellaria atrata CBS 101060]|uniref:Life-span regulatory factor domain-containing protein n=1 Tax=Patellaria atrata CBS 101060 TaxID=1346257 RepID=A0A9P4SF00_9PEZI|nr:hypothetical protein M501DRAFT_931051 [Patellaria atrata CBS 101060]